MRTLILFYLCLGGFLALGIIYFLSKENKPINPIRVFIVLFFWPVIYLVYFLKKPAK
jgi:hypothetical protein